MSARSKKRRATKRRHARRFGEILAKGGSVVAHPDTIASLKRQLNIAYPNDARHRGHVKLIANALVPRGQLVAVAPMPSPALHTLLDPMPSFVEPSRDRLTWYRGR